MEDPTRSPGLLFPAAVFCLMIGSLALISKLYADGHLEIQMREAELSQERVKLKKSRVTVRRLESEIEALQTDEGVEMVARDKLKFVRPEEVVIVPLKAGH